MTEKQRKAWERTDAGRHRLARLEAWKAARTPAAAPAAPAAAPQADLSACLSGEALYKFRLRELEAYEAQHGKIDMSAPLRRRRARSTPCGRKEAAKSAAPPAKAPAPAPRQATLISLVPTERDAESQQTRQARQAEQHKQAKNRQK